ncbi:MAG: DUF456 domain-containing protein [Candidatus Alcyoniella australis]|nr:DUF456 domain-containing protein [Candidatus Alcyoniella australis]
MWAVILIWIAVVALFALGMVGIVVPVLPGLALVWAGIVLYAVLMGLDQMPLWFVITTGVITLLMTVLDYLSGLLGAKGFGAGKWGMLGAFAGLVLGVVLGSMVGLPIVGLLFGPLVGAVIAELIAGKTHGEAMKAGLGTFVGFLAGAVMKFVAGMAMIVAFIILAAVT